MEEVRTRRRSWRREGVVFEVRLKGARGRVAGAWRARGGRVAGAACGEGEGHLRERLEHRLEAALAVGHDGVEAEARLLEQRAQLDVRHTPHVGARAVLRLRAVADEAGVGVLFQRRRLLRHCAEQHRPYQVLPPVQRRLGPAAAEGGGARPVSVR